MKINQKLFKIFFLFNENKMKFYTFYQLLRKNPNQNKEMFYKFHNFTVYVCVCVCLFDVCKDDDDDGDGDLKPR